MAMDKAELAEGRNAMAEAVAEAQALAERRRLELEEVQASTLNGDFDGA